METGREEPEFVLDVLFDYPKLQSGPIVNRKTCFEWRRFNLSRYEASISSSGWFLSSRNCNGERRRRSAVDLCLRRRRQLYCERSRRQNFVAKNSLANNFEADDIFCKLNRPFALLDGKPRGDGCQVIRRRAKADERKPCDHYRVHRHLDWRSCCAII